MGSLLLLCIASKLAFPREYSADCFVAYAPRNDGCGSVSGFSKDTGGDYHKDCSMLVYDIDMVQAEEEIVPLKASVGGQRGDLVFRLFTRPQWRSISIGADSADSSGRRNAIFVG